MEETKVKEFIKDGKLIIYARKRINGEYKTPMSICDINISEEEKQEVINKIINSFN